MSNNLLSLVRNCNNENDESEEEDQDMITFNFDSNIIQINYTQLFKYSQLIRNEYLISDARNKLPQKLLQFQQQNRIDINNIKYFFQLLQEEEISMTSDKYKDFLKLAGFFKAKKLILQLKKYYESHITDVDFIIQLFVDELDHQNDSHNYDYFFTTQIKDLMSEKINECLQNELFQRIPIPTIYQILDNSDKESIASDLLVDFIKNSIDERFVLLKFVKLKNLSDEKFSDLEEILFNKDRSYYQYLPCDFEYIKELRMTKKENNFLKTQLNQKNEEKNQMESRINDLENEVNELKSKLNEIQEKKESFSKSSNFLNLGLNYLLGTKKTRNSIEAINFLKISSSQGNFISSFIIGILYESGEEIESNIEESLKYYELSAQQGYSGGFYRIGRCYDIPIKVKQDYSKAIEYYEKAAELNDLNALYNLGMLYKSGEGVEQDYDKAREYYEKAAELGNPNALNGLGVMYHNGQGVQQDYNKARECYEKAGELGCDVAFKNLGLLYECGFGVTEDISKAIECYEKAAELGNESAEEKVKLLRKKK